MSFAKTLLAGAALCALCTAPALARQAPNIHLAASADSAKMKVGSPGHFKTDLRNPGAQNFTETVTFSATLTASSALKNPIFLAGETWYQPSTCSAPTNEKGSYPKSTPVAKIKSASTTGTISGCGSTIFTFYGPLYTLKDKHAKSDAFSGSVVAKKFVGYNLTLNENFNLSIIK